MGKGILGAVAGLFFAVNAPASVLYIYEGADYIEVNDGPTPGAYASTMHVGFELQFAEAIDPNSAIDFGYERLSFPVRQPEFWAVSDGRHYWDSNISGPFEDNPPWVPRFDYGRLFTDDNGEISSWFISFNIHNYYPEEHPVPLVHLVYSVFPPTNPESPSAVYDVAKVSNANPPTFEFDDEAYTSQAGSWQKVQVVPLPSGGWLFLSGLPLLFAMLRGKSEKPFGSKRSD